MPDIHTSFEAERGCGFRQPGGTYLVSTSEGRHCGRFPVELHVCPTCSQGIKPARGWTWVESGPLFESAPCRLASAGAAGGAYSRAVASGGQSCLDCPIWDPGALGRCGLIWIGGSFYPTPKAFDDEAARQGISRRITSIPRGFKLGATRVLLGHRKVDLGACPSCSVDRDPCNPGSVWAVGPAHDGGQRWVECEACEGTGRRFGPAIFKAFLPDGIDYVVKGDEFEEDLERLEKRGARLVRVVPSRTCGPCRGSGVSAGDPAKPCGYCGARGLVELDDDGPAFDFEAFGLHPVPRPEPFAPFDPDFEVKE